MEIGTVKLIDIDREMRAAYLDYAMSVITARALPDVRDGLKPVQRRILYAMNEIGVTHTAAYKKSARIVGEVLGKYHPHGDAPVYETMVRLAQDFSMRYMLVDGQGNFGSVDGDPPAAMRYTEARLAAIADEMLADLDKNTVDFVDNFDATLKEPSVLPARLPNLLVNGAAGIAVGMATNIPPHNLSEVVDAIVFMLERFERAVKGGVPFDVALARVHSRPVDAATLQAMQKGLSAELKELVAREYGAKVSALERAPKTKEQKAELEQDALLDVIDQAVDAPIERLMEIIVGPDFPTGGIIVGRKGIVDAYTTGRGRIVIRAKAFVEDRGSDRSTIIITEIPYQVNKATLVERIADLVREKRIDGVSELRDESDRQGMRIVIELRRDVPAKQLLNNLYKLTAMQSAFSVNLLALVDGEPRVLTLKRLLQHHIEYRFQVISRRTQFDLDKARARAHILEGLKIALDNLDEVISTIRNSPDAEVARTRLMKKFKLSELQAQAILDMQLRRLAALERKKIEDELAEMRRLIGELEDLLAHPIKLYGLIRQDLLDVKQRFGDERRTKIRDEEAEDFTAEDLIPDEDVVVAISTRGYVKRAPADQYRAQARRSTARTAVAAVTKEQDPPALLHPANTHDSIMFLSNLGKVYVMKCHEIPAADRQARGTPLNNFLSTVADEVIVGVVAVREQNGGSVTLVTRGGDMKRVLLADLAGARAAGLNVMALAEKDEVVWAGQTAPEQEIVIVTGAGKAIRFTPETEARASGRGSGGVRAIKLDGDTVVAVDVVDKDGDLLVLTAMGFGKRTALAQYSAQGRGGGGIMTAAITDKTGQLTAARVVAPGDEVLVISAQGQVVRKAYEELAAQPRAGRGGSLIALEKGDRAVAALRLAADKKSPAPTEAPEPDTGPAPAPGKTRAAAKAEPGKKKASEAKKKPQAKPAPKTTEPKPARAKPAAPVAEPTPEKTEPKAPRAKPAEPALDQAPARAEPKPSPAAEPAPAKVEPRPVRARSAAPAAEPVPAKAEPKAPEQAAPPVLRAASVKTKQQAEETVAAVRGTRPAPGEPSVLPPPSPVRTGRLKAGSELPPSPVRTGRLKAGSELPPSPVRTERLKAGSEQPAQGEPAPSTRRASRATREPATKPAPSAPLSKPSRKAALPAPATDAKKRTAETPAPEPAGKKRTAETPAPEPAGKKRPARFASLLPDEKQQAPARQAPAKPAGKPGNGIVVRSGGKVTVIPRTPLPFDNTPQSEPPAEKPAAAKKKAAGKPETQIPLPLWGVPPKKKGQQ